MVDRVIFLIYGVTWCVGVTMPIVIFCIYRTFLRWGWVKNYQSIAIYQLFLIQSGPELLVKSSIVDLHFLQGLQSHGRWGRGGPNCCSVASRSRICPAETRRQKKYPSNLINIINSHTEKDRESREKI